MQRHFFRFAFAIILMSGLGFAAEPPLVAPGEHRSPADELKAFKLPPGFEAQLVAAEPDIQKPINIAFDARGRLWVTCTVEYPYPAKDRPGRDSLRILDDFGPDGRARKVTTFADGLNIPIGVLPDPDCNGALVWSIPNIWHLRDTKGTGQCDSRDVLLTGFGTRDTHGMVNGFVRGFDGWVYACHGYINDSDVKAKDGSRIVMNSGNTFRFKPDGSRIEMMCRGQVNPFGQCLDPLGNLYTACCHSKPITQLMRGAVYPSFSKPHDGLGFGPEMIHDYRGSTALCGLAWYEADHYPPEYRGRMFLGDVVYNCVNIFDIERNGATYAAKQQKQDFLSSSDPWFRPVDIKLGPDGALYIADFYNRIIGHYEVPLEHPGRDRTSGRIWRIVRTDKKPIAPRSDWTKATVAELIGDLSHPNLTVRMTATHQLMERGEAAVPLLKAQSTPTGAPTSRVHALWALERLGKLDDAQLAIAATDKDLMVRVQALRIMAERLTLNEALVTAARNALSGDSDGLCRRMAAEVLGRIRSTDNLRALLAVRRENQTGADPYLLHAVRIALREHVASRYYSGEAFARLDYDSLADAALGVPSQDAADLIADFAPTIYERMRRRMPEFLHHVARYGSADRIGKLDSVIRELLKTEVELPTLLAIVRGTQERGGELSPAFAELASKHCVQLLDGKSADELQNGVDLVTALRRKSLYGNLAIVGLDRKRKDELRTTALTALARLDGVQYAGTLALRLADDSESLALREKVAQALAGVNSADARKALVDALGTAHARFASAIATGLAGSRDGANALLDAVAAGKASPRLLLERPVEVRLMASKLPKVHERIATLTAGLPPADKALSDLLRRRAAAFAKTNADAAAGAKIFKQHCATCHQIRNEGTKIGPQLDGIGVRGLERLLEDTLDPNRNVDQSFRTTIFNLKSGQSLNGLVLREEGEVVVWADAQGKEQRVSKSQIETRETSPLSPMPANWSEQITEKDMIDLMAYLLSQRAK